MIKCSVLSEKFSRFFNFITFLGCVKFAIFQTGRQMFSYNRSIFFLKHIIHTSQKVQEKSRVTLVLLLLEKSWNLIKKKLSGCPVIGRCDVDDVTNSVNIFSFRSANLITIYLWPCRNFKAFLLSIDEFQYILSCFGLSWLFSVIFVKKQDKLA